MTLGEFIVPDITPDASRLCARGKGRGLTIKGELHVYRVHGHLATRVAMTPCGFLPI